MADPPRAPVRFSKEIADAICARLEAGETLRSICRSPGMPTASNVWAWKNEDRGPGFAEQYARARDAGYALMAEEIVEISDNGQNDFMERALDNGEIKALPDHEHIQRSKLRVDTRRWLLSKALPKIYGDKLNISGTGENGEILIVSGVRRVIDAP